MIVMQARSIFPRLPVKSIRGIIRKTPGHQPGQARECWPLAKSLPVRN